MICVKMHKAFGEICITKYFFSIYTSYLYQLDKLGFDHLSQFETLKIGSSMCANFEIVCLRSHIDQESRKSSHQV